ncbi:carbamoyltransferase [Actinomadura sp. 1N219]|uniref:carbamoyltransferase n=1 Tax=Actinomadura sp. 1N219 TaxID=3375152 RepID=UPI0037B221BC
MYVLGINGFFSRPNEDFVPGLPEYFFHDASAVLLHDGQVVAAVEQERLSRIKHTNRFPGAAIRACLDRAGITFRQLDRIAFFFAEEWVDKVLFQLYSAHPETGVQWSRRLIADRIREAFGEDVPDDKLAFVPHHLSHAYSTYPQSGYDDALVVVMDGQGEGVSTSFYSAEGDSVERLSSEDIDHSIGHLYTAGTEILGYRLFDEYKVMGLAPYGDPDVYAGLFADLYRLRDDGRYGMNHQDLKLLALRAGVVPRRKGEPMTQRHMDFAAGLQRATEELAGHMIAHWRRVTGHRRLAIAGGVGQNCTLNGKLLACGDFDDVFVHPAAHDAGAALGAALRVHQESAGGLTRDRVRSVFWGPGLPAQDAIAAELDRWAEFVTYRRSDDVAGETAARIAGGEVVGWMQGRSEFGPRALGNRSILADPRPQENHSRVNLMVKNRESYRPFAPSVQAESLRDYFEFPADAPTPDFMVFTVPVRSEYRSALAAITHVDGTARVHAVAREVNPRYWELLEEFEKQTGFPLLLNTSFNNHAEPIVDSVRDGVRCFLTTGLDRLVIGDYVVTKRDRTAMEIANLVPTLPAFALLEKTVTATGETGRLTANYAIAKSSDVGDQTFEILRKADGSARLVDLGVDASTSAGLRTLEEIEALWRDRLLDLAPRD